MLVTANDLNMPTTEMRKLLFESIHSRGDKVFIVDGLEDVELTYKELSEKATSVAIYLNRAGIGDGTTVAVLSDVLIEANIFIVGVWLSGATLCPMNPTLGPDEIQQLLDICGAQFVYCQEKYLGLLESVMELGCGNLTVFTDIPHPVYIHVDDMLNEDPSDFEIGDYDPHETITHVLFTSGTTGIPKGVMITSHSSKITVFRLSMDEGQAFLCTSPLYWISYVAVVMWTLTSGSKLIIPRTRYIAGTKDADLSHVLECIQRYKASNWFAGPSLLLDLCTLPSTCLYDLSSLSKVGVGGSHILSSQRKEICDILFDGKKLLYNMYGATETGIITDWPAGEAPDHDSPRASSVGILAAGVSLKVVDTDTGVELGPGEIGEFVVKSESIMVGYMNKDMPRRYTPDDWYHLGDLGYYDEDGYLYFTSRLKEIMKYRGLQIAPAELERVIILHPAVQEVCVVGRPHDIDGERPAAFVVRKSDDISKEELLEFVAERVPDSKKLRGGLFFVNAIPKSGVGKTLRRELLKLFETEE